MLKYDMIVSRFNLFKHTVTHRSKRSETNTMKTILIIDDEAFVHEYLGKVISRLGYQVETAASATAGLNALKNSQIDLVIADVYLPDSPMPYQWLGQLAETAAGRPIVLISGAPTDELVQNAAKCGISTFLSKPFELAFIRNVLTDTLN